MLIASDDIEGVRAFKLKTIKIRMYKIILIRFERARSIFKFLYETGKFYDLIAKVFFLLLSTSSV